MAICVIFCMSATTDSMLVICAPDSDRAVGVNPANGLWEYQLYRRIESTKAETAYLGDLHHASPIQARQRNATNREVSLGRDCMNA